MDDREVVAAIAAADPRGINVAYDRYAAALYGYCHWMLLQPESAAQALRDTFVIAAVTLGDVPESTKLRPWLYAVARNECLRRLPATQAISDGRADAPAQRTDLDRPAAAVDQAPRGPEPIDATMPFRVISEAPGAGDLPMDATMSFRVVPAPPGAGDLPMDATMSFRVVPAPPGAGDQPIDTTMSFRVVSEAGHPADVTMPIDVAALAASVADYAAAAARAEQADMGALVRGFLDELKPLEREVIELNLRHDLYDADLATALGLSWNRAHALASRAHQRLGKALDALVIARTGRQACPALDALLADWDGRLTEPARDRIGSHIEHCEICSRHKHGPLRPAALSCLPPLAGLPARLREQIIGLCTLTTADAIGYRRQVVQRPEPLWPPRLYRAISQVRWNPQVAVAIAVSAVWVAVAVIVTFYAVTGYHTAHAPAARPTVRVPASSPAAVTNITTASPAAASTSASPSPSPTFSQPASVVPPPVLPSASSSATSRPSPSRSPQPSTTPSAKPSTSPSPTPSPSPSASPSPSPTASPSH